MTKFESTNDDNNPNSILKNLQFFAAKDNWLVNGLFDYYLSTNSTRAMDVLAGVREPHDKHLLDRLTDSLTASKPNNNEHKVRTLALFSHVVRRSPTLLYKLPNHQLFKELLKLLKVHRLKNQTIILSFKPRRSVKKLS